MFFLQKIKNSPAPFKASIAFFVAGVVTKGIAYFVTPVYTRLLTPEDYGVTSIFLTWLELFGIVAMFCLSYGVFNNGMVDYPKKRDEYSLSMLALSNVITVLFSIILLTIYPFIQHFVNLDISFILLMCAYFLFFPAYRFWTAKQRYEYKYKSVFLWTILLALISPAIAITCIAFSDSHRLYARIFGAEIPLISIYIGFYIYLIVKARGKLNIKYWKSAILFNLPLIPHYLSSFMLGSSDKIMISNLINNRATAFYSVAYSVSAVVMIVWSAANASLVPHTYENLKKQTYEPISKAAMFVLYLFCACCFLIILFAPELVKIMATAEYYEAIYVIPPVVGGVFFQMQYYLYANVLYYFKKPKFVMIGSVFAMLLNVGLNYIFIPVFGYIAAGYTTLVCYALQAFIDYLAMRHVFKEKLYNMKLICLVSCAIVIFSITSGYLYGFFILRYVFVGLITMCLLLKRKKIIEKISVVRK